MPILGNVAPVDYFIQGTKEEMDAAVKRCLQKLRLKEAHAENE